MDRVQPSSSRWHPRVNIYRLFVLSTTIGIGCVKIYSSFQSESFLPVTLEWVGGVAVFLVLYILSHYDSHPRPPKMIRWLFDIDCLACVCALTRKSRPTYLSNQIFPIPRRRRHLIIRPKSLFTLYRLLVTVCIAGFGTVKATLGYYGFSIAASWIDWMVGVVLSVLLYSVGLYEHNSVGMLPWLFEDDYGDVVSGARYSAWITTKILFSLGWILGSLFSLYLAITQEDIELTIFPDRTAPTTVERLYYLSSQAGMAVVSLLFTMFGLGMLVSIYSNINEEKWWTSIVYRIRTCAGKISTCFTCFPILRMVAAGIVAAYGCLTVAIEGAKNCSARAIAGLISPYFQNLIFRLISRTFIHFVSLGGVSLALLFIFGSAYHVYFIPLDDSEIASEVGRLIYRVAMLAFLAVLFPLCIAWIAYVVFQSLFAPFQAIMRVGYTPATEREVDSYIVLVV